ncbi:CGNR zinc finger domain-containing protein [Ktedonosporobacter rubrisoli]|uniref:CGNR zinc finger domain-containing protein n=1 Tax=Ktedonosporobacter rubrisoli TaxID=2509675 RepID=A0A4P6JN41_KTERU|nr:CGNR zinc finger domain-containing protein [Ktedonosporobacter rubrisoli]QBD76490.1 CGNR zinc finger domain-containing protein [Ktedonosporobacter rubrisoli]
MSKEDSQEAPGTLEIVRTFLNTWRIPNDTREPIDEFASLEAMQHFYATHFEASGADSAASIIPELVRQLRADLRSILGTGDILRLNKWLVRQPVEVVLTPDSDEIPLLKYRPAGKEGCRLCAEVLALVVEAIAHSTWTRVKACPDCQWVFYDHTKNKNKIWCLMTASGPQGRSCGSISKVRNFRKRQKARAARALNLPDNF